MATLSSCKITVVLAQMTDGVRYEHMAKKNNRPQVSSKHMQWSKAKNYVRVR